MAEWRFLLFTMIVTVNRQICNVIRMGLTPLPGGVANRLPLWQRLPASGGSSWDVGSFILHAAACFVNFCLRRGFFMYFLCADKESTKESRQRGRGFDSPSPLKTPTQRPRGAAPPIGFPRSLEVKLAYAPPKPPLHKGRWPEAPPSYSRRKAQRSGFSAEKEEGGSR